MMEEVRIALRNVGKIRPDSIEDYLASGGYEALKKARSLDRGELIQTIEETSRLRGRGGAAFSTGKKWSSAYASKEETKYLVCNADEGEPGTYKDRVIMEGDPHTVIEGILIGAYAVGAKDCFIYVRGEYEKSIKLLRKAVKAAEEKGLTGDVTIKVVSGAGAYVCGEGTAIVNSLEGLRGEPRLKPPSMAVKGLHQKPTVVNNVETFAVIPEIVAKGADWFGAIGAEKFPGTKLMCLSGDVTNKVCVELPTNATLRDVVEGFGGGVANGKKLKAIQLGGSSCGFVTPDKLDTPIDFDSIRAIGAALGSGAVYVIDETRNVVDILAEIARFFRHESCGKCTPCREGTMRIAELMDKIAAGEGTKADVDLIKTLSGYMQKTCFCPLGQSATTAFMSALKLFPEDFDAKLKKEA
ncbi:MAG: SLBB domain-containing protein [Oscillospiraceae bacterium]|nr:SLBB domain-containing protein [Oscillospiraceae bacterium]